MSANPIVQERTREEKRLDHIVHRRRIKKRLYDLQDGRCLFCGESMLLLPHGHDGPLNATFLGGRTARKLVHQKCQPNANANTSATTSNQIAPPSVTG